MSLTNEDKDWINAQLERIETSLLTEFHKWASPIEMRMRSHTATLRALDVELESVSERVTKLEPPIHWRFKLPQRRVTTFFR
jgi:hypothetical protein